MNFKTTLYKKPFIVGTVFLFLGFILGFFGLTIANEQKNSDGYALVAFGVVFLIISVVTLTIYGALERKFKNALKNPLFSYHLDEEQYAKGAQKNISDIRETNKMMLFIMLFFCVILVILGPFIAEDGYIISIIGIGLGIFLTLAKIIITRFRVGKVKKGSKLVVLSKGGAYVAGEFHCFNTKATRLDSVILKETQGEKNIFAYLEIVYTALAVPACGTYTCRIPVPQAYMEQAKNAIEILIQEEM